MELTQAQKVRNSEYIQTYWAYWIIEILFSVLVIYVQYMTVTELVTLALAASFVGRAIAYLKVFEWLRAPFVKIVKHESGVGEYNEPKYKQGALAVLGFLITCPVCAGTWAAAILALLPHSYTQILAVACVAWFVTYVTEALEWWKCANWEKAGYYRRQKN